MHEQILEKMFQDPQITYENAPTNQRSAGATVLFTEKVFSIRVY